MSVYEEIRLLSVDGGDEIWLGTVILRFDSELEKILLRQIASCQLVNSCCRRGVEFPLNIADNLQPPGMFLRIRQNLGDPEFIVALPFVDARKTLSLGPRKLFSGDALSPEI